MYSLDLRISNHKDLIFIITFIGTTSRSEERPIMCWTVKETYFQAAQHRCWPLKSQCVPTARSRQPFQSLLVKHRRHALIRTLVRKHLNYVPEIKINRHSINIIWPTADAFQRDHVPSPLTFGPVGLIIEDLKQYPQCMI